MGLKNPAFEISDDCNEVIDRKYEEEKKPATFEEVVTILGFGKFNVTLIAMCSIGMWCSALDATSTSYIFNSAKCDLGLTLQDKGYLNSVTYVGMISSAVLWGYGGDTLGRRRILLAGFFLDALIVLMSAVSQNLTTLLACKFLSGFVISGPHAVLISYISEFLASRYRPRVMLYFGFMNSFALTGLPLLAWGVLSQTWKFGLFNGYLEFHSWNIFLIMCSLPAIISFILYLFLPESPKFLMTAGKNEEAMKIFRRIYAINTGEPAANFPIKKLINERGTTTPRTSIRKMSVTVFRKGVNQTRQIFRAVYLRKLILVCVIQMLILGSQTMLRLWVPQILQAIEDYKQYSNGSSSNLCDTLEVLRDKPIISGAINETCTTMPEHSSVYINSMMISLVNMGGYLLTGTIINLLGKKKVMIILSFIGGASSCLLFYSPNGISTTGLLMVFTSASLVSGIIVMSLPVDLFPTTLRTMTVSLVMMVGRTGVVVGGILFPLFLSMGCALPFLVVGVMCGVGAILGCFLPNTENKPLK